MTIRQLGRAALLLCLAIGAAKATPTAPWPEDWAASASTLRSLDGSRFGPLDLDRLAAEDAYQQALGQPPRFAVAHPLSVTPARDGHWHARGELMIWQHRVQAEGALSLNFGFRNLHLPEGALLMVYATGAAEKGAEDPWLRMGPWDRRIHQAHGEFWTPMVHADDVIIELRVPAAVAEQARLELIHVGQGYRGFGQAALEYRQRMIDGEGKTCKDGDGGGRSGACNMDVACLADDDPWNDPRRAVGAYSRNGSFACTGALVNNTANDRRMLFLTATHCGITTSNVQTVVVYWNYEWPTCRTPGASIGTAVNPPNPNITSNGLQRLMATTNPFTGGGCTVPGNCSDVNLIELAGTPNPAWNLYWAGWDRNPAAANCGPQGAPGSTAGLCASIHHPGVHEKRITFVETPFVTGNIGAAQGVHWHAFWHTNPPVLANIPAPQPSSIPPGVTEPGSSGSPLFNAERRIVGVLSGGPAACGATGASLSDFYGKLAHAWEGLGTAQTRLRDHLDPLGLAPMALDGRGLAPFGITLDPALLWLCRDVGSAEVSVEVSADSGFNGAVTLAASGAPAGASTSFSVNPVNAPGSSLLTLGNLAQATPGTGVLRVDGSSGGDQNGRDLPWSLNATAPNPVAPQIPADGAVGVSATPTLSWTGSTAAGRNDYLVEVSASEDFSAIVFSTTVTDQTSVSISPPLQSNTFYWWRVRATNACGSTPFSAAARFRTALAPGQCDDEATPTTLFFDNVDAGPGGWSTAGSSGASTWTRSTARPFSGTHAWFAAGIPTVSDQRLTSQPIALPANENPLTLSFQTWRQLEIQGTNGCYDAGILEISADGGPFVQVANAQILGNDGYRGLVASNFQNPLAGRPGWCDDPERPYGNGPVRVDLSPWAGSTVQLRFRVGTDSSVSREGWYIDDIRVQSCQVRGDAIFANGFEAAE